MESKSSFLSCENLDRVANRVGSSMASAFFASLERCSCINLNTPDLDDVQDPGDDRSLIHPGPADPLDSDQKSEPDEPAA